LDALSNFTIPGFIFLLTMVFGLWLSRLGKPYNGLLFNIHKLAALGAVVLTVIRLSGALKNVDSMTSIIVLLALAVICVVALFATGALMSLGKLDYNLLVTIHKIAPVALAVFATLAVALLAGISPFSHQ